MDSRRRGQKLARRGGTPYGRRVRRILSSPSPRARRWAARVGLAAALAASLAYVPYRLLDPASARTVAAMRAELERTRARQRELAEQNAEFRRDIDGLRADPRAVEDVARDELGMLRPDEIAIQIEPRAAGEVR